MRVRLHLIVPVLGLGLGMACGDPDDGPTDYQSGSAVQTGDAALPDAGSFGAPGVIGVPGASDAAAPFVPGSAADAALQPTDAGSVVMGVDSGGPLGGPPASDGGSSTSGDAGRDAGTGADAGGDAGASGCALTYENFGKQFMTKYCVTCHTGLFASHFVQLDSLAGVQTNKAAVKRQAVTGTTMPQADPKPTAAERKQLGEWLDCGPK
jgi:hypothetical protein